MSVSRGLVPLLAALSVIAATTAAALASPLSWGNAIEVPGTAALNLGGTASVGSVSCASPGNCAAGGSYSDAAHRSQAFVAAEKSGVWGAALEVPGTQALNLGVPTSGGARVNSVSCVRPGACAAGGRYSDASNYSQAFVVSEQSGAWGKAIQVPGTAALNHGDAELSSVSCGGSGNCAGGGYYTDRSQRTQVFVVAEKRGKWNRAIEVPGSSALNRNGLARLNSVSCTHAGTCAAGGYFSADSKAQAFVVVETNGVWRKAIEVPGSAALNRGGDAQVDSVSCAGAGDCAAGGFYADRSGKRHAFVVTGRGGTWGTAREVPGIAALNHGNAGVDSISCASAGNCTAGGHYTDRSHETQVFVVAETSGKWGSARQVPGTAALNHGEAAVNSISCARAGSCAAGGYYTSASHKVEAFVVVENIGKWGVATKVPGTSALNHGVATVYSVSCADAGHCLAGGQYSDSSGRVTNAFVTSP